MKHARSFTLILAGIVLVYGTTSTLAVQPQLQQQDPANGCSTQACIDTLQSAPGLPSQPQSTPLQSAPSTSPQNGVPLQPAGNDLEVLGSDAFEPATHFDAGMLWIAIGLLVCGFAGLIALAKMLMTQSAMRVVQAEPSIVDASQEDPAQKTPNNTAKSAKRRKRKNHKPHSPHTF